ncbi:caspase family protein [Rhodoferax sp.]|uniref:caspase family protein n=1 Tax=Rhodoferax sp. TaxID=50421 RepID=UPI00276E9E1A|nr:caspase family protein [Rhodoferax sp.]
MNARRYGSFLLSVLLCLAAASVQARRVALVVGNDNYFQVTKLEKAVNDADAMARELEVAGFEVKRHHNLTYKQMVVAFEVFYDMVKGGDEIAVFYAGHGVQTERGSYLLPTDIEGETQSQIEKVSYSVNGLLEELDRIKPRFSLIIVDACRDNPLRSRGRTIGVARGLNAPDLAKGQMVIFSAGKNQKALDSLSDKDTHPNGLFTREFAARMRRPGLSVEALAIEVKSSVEQLALSVSHNQRPLIVNDSSGDFFFAGPGLAAGVASAASGSPPSEAAREDHFWQDSKAPDNAEGYEAYLGAYPAGRYAGLARANIARFKGRSTNAPLADAAPSGSVVPTAAAPSATPPVSPSVSPATPPASPPTATPGAAPPDSGAVVLASYTLTNGDKYEGETVGAIRTGRGKYQFANGDRYEGELADNSFTGKGAMLFASGDRYDGEFKRGIKQGKGTYLFANKDRYEGPYVDNVAHGVGVYFFASGDRYEGEFKQGVRQGKGAYRYADGGRYEGDFANNVFEGRGKLFLATGDRYEGDFRHNVREGMGVHFYANRDRYEGSFRGGMPAGTGTHFYANGDRYEGMFEGGVRHGRGTFHFASGHAKGLEFVHGVEKPD